MQHLSADLRNIFLGYLFVTLGVFKLFPPHLCSQGMKKVSAPVREGRSSALKAQALLDFGFWLGLVSAVL